MMLFAVLSCTVKSFASDDKGSVDAGNLIIGHITDSYSWHICSIGEKHISIPLPVILIHDGKLDIFMSSKFHHGHESYKGYKIVGGGITKERIVCVDKQGNIILDADGSSAYRFKYYQNSSKYNYFYYIIDSDIYVSAS